MLQTLVGSQIDCVDAVGEHLFLNAVKVCADNERLEFAVEFVGQFAAFGKQFKAYVGNAAIFKFAIYYNVVHLFLCLLILKYH